MKEQPRHIKAFEYYVSMDKRSLVKVSEKFNVSVQSLIKWSKAFGWKERIAKRDKNTSIELAKQTDKAILKTKAEYRVEVQQVITLIRAAMAQMADKIKDKTFRAGTAKDLGTLTKALDIAINLEQSLAGEAQAMLGTTININLLPVDPAPRQVAWSGPSPIPVESKEIEK